MTRRQVWIAVAVVVVVAFFLSGGGAAVVTLARGRRVTDSTIGPDGLVKEDPAALAKSAGLPLDVYALARMLRSEGGGGSVAQKTARAWVARNDARASFRGSVFDCVTFRTKYGKGRFGPQNIGPGRYATTKDPYDDDVRIATDVIAGRVPDPTGGATKFVDKGSFGKQPGTRTYDVVAAEWRREGYVPSNVPGVSDDFVVFRKV